VNNGRGKEGLKEVGSKKEEVVCKKEVEDSSGSEM